MEKNQTATGRWAIIANPAAARGRAPLLAAAASRYLGERGIAADLLVSEGRGHACELARKAIAEGAGRIVTCGGDGTVNEILPAVAGSRAALGLLPCGTANDFARALGIPRQPRRALRNLVEGREVRVDLGACGDRYFCTVAACGFDAEVSEAMREGRRLPGTAGYLWAALRHLFRFEPAKVAATGDFGRLETEVLLVAAAVTRSYGGGMRIAPHADPADGRFDVVIIGPVARRTVVAMLPRLFRGSHVRHPAVRIERSSFLEIETPGGARPLYADGEPLGETPVSLRIAPGSLRVIVPRPPALGMPP